MEKFSRSKSSRESVVQPNKMNGLRSYSTCAHNLAPNIDHNIKGESKEVKIKKVNSSKNWGINLDAEFQRKKRVASYKAYDMEGRMKGSLKKSFKWIKNTCNHVVNGIW